MCPLKFSRFIVFILNIYTISRYIAKTIYLEKLKRVCDRVYGKDQVLVYN